MSLPLSSSELHASVTLFFEDEVVTLLDGRTGLRVAAQSAHIDALSGVVSFDEGTRKELIALGLTQDLPLTTVRRLQAPLLEEAVADNQLRRLRLTLEYVCDEVPYYRERRDRYDAREVKTLEDVAQLPVLTRKDLQSQPTRAWLADAYVARAQAWLRTSGTTGRPLRVAVEALPFFPPCSPAVFGVQESFRPRVAILSSPLSEEDGDRLPRVTYAERQLEANAMHLHSRANLFETSPDDVRKVIEELQRFGANTLLVNPAYAHWMVLVARENEIQLPSVELVLSSYQTLTQGTRALLQEAFRSPVFDYYAATDLAGAKGAIECVNGLLHSRVDQVYLEMGDLSPSSILATTLENRAMPLVRYAVGDLGMWSKEWCGCEMAGWKAFSLHGREGSRFEWAGCQSEQDLDALLSPLLGQSLYQCTWDDERRTMREVVVASPSSSLQVTVGLPWTGTPVRAARALAQAASSKVPLVRFA